MAGKKGKCGSCHADLPVLFTEPQELGEVSFDDFLQDYPGPILAEFWAPW
jgi:thioredoxin 2